MDQCMEKGELKIIRQFEIDRTVDHMIQRWARSKGFVEGNPPGPKLMDENNHAYCFYKQVNESTVCVMIDTLDQQMRLEAWIVDQIRSGGYAADMIFQLIDLLNQQPRKA